MTRCADKPPMVFARILSFALPPRCAGCGCVVPADDELCAPCWSSLDFLTGEGCLTCGVPMDDQGMMCARCMETPPAHDGVRAAVRYGGLARDLAVRLKHGRRLGLARLMAAAMARHVAAEPNALFIPVPLHRWRIWRRGFNQSVEIGRALVRLTGVPMDTGVLARTRATPMLGQLGRRQRARAVQGVFAVAKEAKPRLHGRHVLLIDDVHTSGATSNACARVLKRAGAASVTVLCWARVVQDEGPGN